MTPEAGTAPRADDDLTDQAQALPAKNATDVSLADITLPPKELRDELNNSGAATREEAVAPLEVATLDFFGDDLPFVAIPLKYHFKWQGKAVTDITVRQLNVAQMGCVLADARRAGGAPDLFDFYAEMCGLPAAVLRALPSLDGDKVTEAAWDFLPQWARPAPA